MIWIFKIKNNILNFSLSLIFYIFYFSTQATSKSQEFASNNETHQTTLNPSEVVNITKNATERTPLQDLIMENVTRILSVPRNLNRTLIDEFR